MRFPTALIFRTSLYVFAAYVMAVGTALAAHWALLPSLMLAGVGWLVMFSYSVGAGWAGAGWLRPVLILITLPVAYATQLYLVTNIRSCGHWICF